MTLNRFPDFGLPPVVRNSSVTSVLAYPYLLTLFMVVPTGTTIFFDAAFRAMGIVFGRLVVAAHLHTLLASQKKRATLMGSAFNYKAC